MVGSFEGAFVGLDDGWALGFPVINVCTKDCNFVSVWTGLKLVLFSRVIFLLGCWWHQCWAWAGFVDGDDDGWKEGFSVKHMQKQITLNF